MLPIDHLHSFQTKVKKTRRLLSRQINLSHAGHIPQTELESIYELSFMNIFVAFENDLTELLKTNLLLKHGSDGRIRSLYLPNSRPLAEKLLLGTNRYFQLLPVEQMEKTAKIYLKNGGPFVLLNSNQKGEISKSIAIRNHIAHKSPESKATYQKKVLVHASLPKRSFSPGYYLKPTFPI